MDFDAKLITLERGETKNQEARSVPIVAGDMLESLLIARQEQQQQWPKSPWVFNRAGEPIKDFRSAWDRASKAAGIPQVVRMKISGHKTDSMERRYNIVDAEDLASARELLERRPTVVEL